MNSNHLLKLVYILHHHISIFSCFNIYASSTPPPLLSTLGVAEPTAHNESAAIAVNTTSLKTRHSFCSKYFCALIPLNPPPVPLSISHDSDPKTPQKDLSRRQRSIAGRLCGTLCRYFRKCVRFVSQNPPDNARLDRPIPLHIF